MQVSDIQTAILWLDTHYIFTAQQLRSIATRLAGSRKFARLDSLVDSSKLPVRPC